MTIVDGRVRGRAVLSVKYITNCPIKFMRCGAKISDLEKLHSNIIDSRILMIGVLRTVIEKAVDDIGKKVVVIYLQECKKVFFSIEYFIIQFRNLKNRRYYFYNALFIFYKSE